MQAGFNDNNIKDLRVKINNTIIENNYILSLNLKFNIEDIKIIGQLTLNDIGYIDSIPIRGSDKINISLKDNYNSSYLDDFVIININYKPKDVNIGYIAVLDIIDKTTFNLLSSYPDLSFEKANINQVISKSNLFLSKKTNFVNDTFYFENLVVPKDRSFYKTLNDLKLKTNKILTQSRNYYHLQDFKNFNSKSSKAVYLYKPENSNYANYVYEYEVSFGNTIESSTFIPNSKNISFDDEFGFKTYEMDYNKSVNLINSKGLKANNYKSLGTKHFYRNYYSLENETNFSYLRNIYEEIEVTILIKGNLNNNIGDIITFNIGNMNKDTQTNPNIFGDFLVSEITDVISYPNYLQRVKLVRSKF